MKTIYKLKELTNIIEERFNIHIRFRIIENSFIIELIEYEFGYSISLSTDEYLFNHLLKSFPDKLEKYIENKKLKNRSNIKWIRKK